MLPNPRHFSILVSNEQLYLASNCYIYRRQIHEWMEIFQMHHISIRLNLYETQKSLSSDINCRKVFSQITECKFNLLYLYACIYHYRSARAEEAIWGEDEDFSDHNYYNSIPGKEPPIGGIVDSRLRGSGSLLGHIHSQPQGSSTAQVTLQTHTVNCASHYYCLIWMYEAPGDRWHLCLLLKHARRQIQVKLCHDRDPHHLHAACFSSG